LGIAQNATFDGVDIWNGYELSWLNSKGKPQIAGAVFYIPCHSCHLVESKSFKLYLNSFNQTKFASFEEVADLLKKDLSKAVGLPIQVKLISPKEFSAQAFNEFEGHSLDDLDLTIDCYDTDASFLSVSQNETEETLYSHLLKSNCLVTGQPDWASVQIHYKGPQIDHAGLLRYIVSFRNCLEFHEQCIERIYMDILKHCQPQSLSVYGRYTRRGGLDINPFRSNVTLEPKNTRHWRQ
jgi:7-cyano-7-deazaguanine reductase